MGGNLFPFLQILVERPKWWTIRFLMAGGGRGGGGGGGGGGGREEVVIEYRHYFPTLPYTRIFFSV